MISSKKKQRIILVRPKAVLKVDGIILITASKLTKKNGTEYRT